MPINRAATKELAVHDFWQKTNPFFRFGFSEKSLVFDKIKRLPFSSLKFEN
jgi:hypothetical protein